MEIFFIFDKYCFTNSPINVPSSANTAELNKGILKHIKRNFEYPRISKEMGVQEKIFIAFVIDQTGKIVKARVIRGEDRYLKEEALRLVKSIPQMKPANQRGKPVPVKYTIPINFVLQ